MRRAFIILAILLVIALAGDAWFIHERVDNSPNMSLDETTNPAPILSGTAKPDATPSDEKLEALQSQYNGTLKQLNELQTQAKELTDSTNDLTAEQQIQFQMLMTQINQLWTEAGTILQQIYQRQTELAEGILPE